MINPIGNSLDKKDAFYKFIQEINDHNLDGILSTISKEVKIYVSESGLFDNRERVTQFFSDLFNSFPNFFIKPISILYTDTPLKIVMSEVSIGGKQTGYFVGNPPNSKEFLIYGVIIIQFDLFDKITEIRLHYDSRSIYKQLGILKV